MITINEEVAWKYTTKQLGLLTSAEMKCRQELGPEYFVPGKIYRVRKGFMGFRKDRGGDGRRKRMTLSRGDYLLCVKCEKYDELHAVIEFIYHEMMLLYRTDGKTLSCMLDTVELETNE